MLITRPAGYVELEIMESHCRLPERSSRMGPVLQRLIWLMSDKLGRETVWRGSLKARSRGGKLTALQTA